MADGSLSQFKATLARKQARKDKAKGKFERNKMDFKNSDLKTEFDFPKLSDSDLEDLKKEIRSKAKFDRRKELILFGIVVVGLVCLLYYIN